MVAGAADFVETAALNYERRSSGINRGKDRRGARVPQGRGRRFCPDRCTSLKNGASFSKHGGGTIGASVGTVRRSVKNEPLALAARFLGTFRPLSPSMLLE